MSEPIEVQDMDVQAEPGERPEQQIMCLQLMEKVVFFEWGAVISAEAIKTRAGGSQDYYTVRFHLRSGQTVDLSPCSGAEMATAINHVFGKKAFAEPPGDDTESS